MRRGGLHRSLLSSYRAFINYFCPVRKIFFSNEEKFSPPYSNLCFKPRNVRSKSQNVHSKPLNINFLTWEEMLLLCKESFGELPDDDAGGGADVEGVLGAKLGNLNAAIRGIDHFLVNSFHFVAEDEGVFGV